MTMAVCGLLAYTIVLRAQIFQKYDSTGHSAPKNHLVHASDLLWKEEKEVRQYIDTHPEALQSSSLHKAAEFSVGSVKEWYADDLSSSGGPRYKVPSTCKAVGTNCYVFVEDASWTSGRVNQSTVDSVRIYFDSKSPANPSKGIFEMDTAAFGNPPDVDHDPKIIILMMDIKDGYSSINDGYVAGYFYSFNEINPETPGYSTSNFAEIFFLDTNPVNLLTPGGLSDGLSTLAHEFQHMIHFNYDRNELTFINEGCSLLAEVNCGFPIYSQSLFAQEPNHYLLDWRSYDPDFLGFDYSRAARFFVYLRDQVGMGLLRPLVASTLTGTAGIDAALESINADVRFSDIIKNWFIANEVNDRTVDSRYGYIYPDIPKTTGRMCFNPNVVRTIEELQPYASEIVRFKFSTQLRTLFYVTNSNAQVKAVEIGPSAIRIVDVANALSYSDSLYGSTYTEIDFIIMNTDPSYSSLLVYFASGVSKPIELRYDYTEPIGVYNLAANDTVCVTFDAIKGGRLDSVRVALRRNTSIRGGVWEYTGVTRPTPLGNPLALNISANGSSTPSSYPSYPVPWPNWASIDLTSKNISTDVPFAVGFIMDGPYTLTTYNYVMATSGPLGTGPTSFTYSSEPSANWYYYTANTAGNLVVNYLIRAYVSFSATTGVRTTVELNPASFQLGQNYPNPFNPSTSIVYSIPVRGMVTLQVFDILGRSVATLVNTHQEAGTYHTQWNGTSEMGSLVSSGVYFYRLQSGRYSKTERMLFLK
jgi:hypothetical protein